MEFVSASVEVNAPASECFQWFKTLEVYTEIGVSVEKVTPTGLPNGWTLHLRSSDGEKLQVDSEIDTLIPNQLVSWHSKADAPFQAVGRATFDALANDRTLVNIAYDFIPPAGDAGRILKSIYGDDPGWFVRAEVENLKKLVETGQKVPAYELKSR